MKLLEIAYDVMLYAQVIFLIGIEKDNTKISWYECSNQHFTLNFSQYTQEPDLTQIMKFLFFTVYILKTAFLLVIIMK